MRWTILIVFWESLKNKIRFYSQRVIIGLGGTNKERLKPLTHIAPLKIVKPFALAE